MFTSLFATMMRESDTALADAAGVLALFLMLLAALSLPGLA